MGLAGVVLAAGASERMGRPKALLDFRGRPFAVRILEALEALDVKSRVVVLGPDAARVRPSLATHECVIVENPDLTSHAIGSLRAALAALEPIRPSGIVAWPVDLPHVRQVHRPRHDPGGTNRLEGGEGGAQRSDRVAREIGVLDDDALVGGEGGSDACRVGSE